MTLVPEKDYPMNILLMHIRNKGWSVAVHNDYKLNGLNYTFWLFTKNGRCVKGEGRTDLDALRLVSIEINKLERA
jgi:hypothetical protein